MPVEGQQTIESSFASQSSFVDNGNGNIVNTPMIIDTNLHQSNSNFIQGFQPPDPAQTLLDGDREITNRDLLNVMMGNFKNVETQLKTMVDKVNVLEGVVTRTKTKVVNLEIEVTSVKSEVVSLKLENKTLKQEKDELVREVNDVQNLARSNNIIVGGLTQSEDERSEDTEAKVREFFSRVLKLDGEMVDVSVAFRLRNSGATNKPILVKLVHESDKLKILSAAAEHLNNQSAYYVKHDRCKRIRVIRGKLSKFYVDYKRNGHTVKMVDNHLLIDGKKWMLTVDGKNIEEMVNQPPT